MSSKEKFFVALKKLLPSISKEKRAEATEIIAETIKQDEKTNSGENMNFKTTLKRVGAVLVACAIISSSVALSACDDDNVIGPETTNQGTNTSITQGTDEQGDSQSGEREVLFNPQYTYPEVSPEDSLMKFDTYGGKYINPFTCETKDISELGYSSYKKWLHDVFFNESSAEISQFVSQIYVIYYSNVPLRYFIRQAGTSRVFEYNYTPGNSCYISAQQEIDGETQSFPIIGIVNGEVVDNLQGIENFSVDIPVNGEDIQNWIDTLGLDGALKETSSCAIYVLAGKFLDLGRTSVYDDSASLLPEHQGNSDGGVVLNTSLKNGTVRFNRDCHLMNQILITTDPLERVSFGPDGQSYTSPVTVLAGLYLDPELVNEVLRQIQAQATEEAQQ